MNKNRENKNCVPIENIFARFSMVDNRVILTSTDPLLEDWQAFVPEGTLADLKLRSKLHPNDESRTISGLVDEFLQSKATTSSYDSGLTLGLKPLPSRNGKMISIKISMASVTSVYVGIDFSNTNIIMLNGGVGTGKTTFAKSVFPSEISSYIDFSTVDFSLLSPSIRKDYGNSVALSFARNPNLKYLILDHFGNSSTNKRKNHPAIYHDMYMQILDMESEFASMGKTIVLAEEAEISQPTMNIDFNYEDGWYSYSLGGIVFPPVRPRKR